MPDEDDEPTEADDTVASDALIHMPEITFHTERDGTRLCDLTI